MTETVERTRNGAILYDKAIINQISAERFTPQGWPHVEKLRGELRSAGRGNTLYVGNVPRQFVLRHYMRGGLIGKINRDKYMFSGEDLTRSFMEWRLLDKLAANNLNVPRPAAARFVRKGTFYTADIITVRIPDVDVWMLDFDKGSLKPPGPWQQQTLSRLHRSLEKVRALDPALHFQDSNWEQLLEGYFNASRSA